MNIVMLSEHDYAGSGWQITQAIRQHTSHNIIHIKANPHRYGYKTDFLLTKDNMSRITKIIEEADIVHFKGDDPPVRQWHGIRIPERAKIIVTVGGSIFRRHGQGNANGASMARYPMASYMESDFRTALSPDLNYPEFKSFYTQYLIDSESQPYCWAAHNSHMSIGYYPGRLGQKGDQTHILPALKSLSKDFNFKIIPIQGMTHEQSVMAKEDLSLFIDQISVAGCYGNSALEAMQFGVPVIAYISGWSLSQSQGAFKDLPILNPGSLPQGLYNLLKQILSGQIDLTLISKKTKQFCDSFHSYTAGATLWNSIYTGVMLKHDR